MDILSLIQIAVAIALVVTILMQNRGSGLSGLFGGGGENVYLAKRGMERKLFQATIVLSILFFVISLINVII